MAEATPKTSLITTRRKKLAMFVSLLFSCLTSSFFPSVPQMMTCKIPRTNKQKEIKFSYELFFLLISYITRCLFSHGNCLSSYLSLILMMRNFVDDLTKLVKKFVQVSDFGKKGVIKNCSLTQILN